MKKILNKNSFWRVSLKKQSYLRVAVDMKMLLLGAVAMM
jgi:hypothetical protein